MGETITLTAGDGHEFSAYEERPSGTVRGGLVVVQEIFGVKPIFAVWPAAMRPTATT